MENSLITSIGALLLGGSAAALFWKPLLAGIASFVTTNRAGGEIITSYKEHVVLLKESNERLRKENDELRERNDKSRRRISTLETDLRLIKSSVTILLAMTEVDQNDKFRNEVDRLIKTLEESNHDSSQ